MGPAPRSSSTLRLLLVDEDAAARQTLRVALETRIPRPLHIVECDRLDAARERLADRRWDAIAADLDTIDGPETIADWAESGEARAIYALGPGRDVGRAVAAIRAGAADFIEKPLDGAALARRIERQFGRTAPGDIPADRDPFETTPAMRRLGEQIGRVAPAQAPVFVTGGTAADRRAVARSVHERSRRRGGPFVGLDCAEAGPARLADDLVRRGGAFDRADGGTLHLDEIARLPDAVQALLLRFLETSEIGGLDDRRLVSVRVVASARRPLAADGGLRPDLYFRLAVLTLSIPGAETASEVPEAVAPTPPVAARPAAPIVVRPAPVLPLRMQEERIIEAAVDAFDGNVAKAAAALGISPSTIYRRRRPRGETNCGETEAFA